MVADRIIPNTIKILQINSEGNFLKILFKLLIASGISDIIEIVIITPLAKENEFEIIEFCFFVLKKQGIIPKVVESPANVVVKKHSIVLFIVKFMCCFCIVDLNYC